MRRLSGILDVPSSLPSAVAIVDAIPAQGIIANLVAIFIVELLESGRDVRHGLARYHAANDIGTRLRKEPNVGFSGTLHPVDVTTR
jgi:hypothetical protein